MIDGTSRQNASYEYLQEVQVKTSGIDAEYGGALGGVISAVTKSGGNAFHGEFHWYNSGSAFNAIPNLRLETNPVRPTESPNTFRIKTTQTTLMNSAALWAATSLKTNSFSSHPILRKSASRKQQVTLVMVRQHVRAVTDYQNLFNKLSWDATKRIRTNFSWLYTTHETGRNAYPPTTGWRRIRILNCGSATTILSHAGMVRCPRTAIPVRWTSLCPTLRC